MTYVKAALIPVPESRRDGYRELSERIAAIYLDHGAIETAENWGDDIPDGKVTDFHRAVDAGETETIVFSWIIWPDKATHDANATATRDDPRWGSLMSGAKDVMDPSRMFGGSFVTLLDTGSDTTAGYIEGFVCAVPTANREEYTAHSRAAGPILADLGATRLVECWGEDVPHGQATDFYRAVNALPTESIVFSWMEYPSREARDEAGQRMQNDPRLDAIMATAPFDAGRMIYGGFTPLTGGKAAA